MDLILPLYYNVAITSDKLYLSLSQWGEWGLSFTYVPIQYFRWRVSACRVYATVHCTVCTQCTKLFFFLNICAGTIVGMPILINTSSKNKHNSVVEWTNESLEISAEIQGIFTSQQKKVDKIMTILMFNFNLFGLVHTVVHMVEECWLLARLSPSSTRLPVPATRVSYEKFEKLFPMTSSAKQFHSLSHCTLSD